MITKKFDLFWVFYVYIIENLNNNKSDSVNQFICDANPFIWEGQSWDPSLFDKFSQMCEFYDNFSNNGYALIISFIKELDEIYNDIKRIFSSIDINDYIKQTSIIFKNGFDNYFRKYRITN